MGKVTWIVTIVMLLIAAPPLTAEEIEATYWLGAGEEPPADGILNEDHPCGSTITIAIARVPTGSEVLRSEHVYEVNSSGESIREWAVPIDRLPIAVSGKDLFLTHPSNTESLLVVDLAGELSIEPKVERADPNYGSCPDDVDVAESAYLRCVELSDLRTGATRRLVYEGACT